MGGAYEAIGRIIKTLKNSVFFQCFEHLEKGLDIQLQVGQTQLYITVPIYINMARSCLINNELEEAIHYFQKAEAIKHPYEKKWKEERFFIYMGLGKCYQIKGDLEQTQNYLQKAHSFALESNEPMQLMNCYYSLAGLFFKKKNYKKSIQANQKLIRRRIQLWFLCW